MHRGALLLTCTLLVVSCREGGEDSPLIKKEDVKVELGLGGVVANGCWNQIRVQVTNRGAHFRGMLEVRGSGEDRYPFFVPDFFYKAEVELPGVSSDGDTTTRELVFPVLPVGWSAIEVSFRDGGFQRSFTLDPPLLDNHIYRILAVGERVPDMASLLDEIDSFLKKQEEDYRRVHAARLATIEPGELPDFVAALDPFQLVLLWGTRLAEATPEAVEALDRWVETGGVLIAFPPVAAGWGAVVPERVRRLLGIDLEPASISREGFVTSRRGLGIVTTVARSPEGRRFPSPKEDPELHRRIEGSLKRPLSIAGTGHDRGSGGYRYGFGELWKLHGRPIPKRGAVTAALLLYLLGGFLVPAMLLRRLRRPEWTPVAILGAAGIATLGIYFWGLLSSLEAAEIDEITVLEIHDDGNKAKATSKLLLVSPTPIQVDLTDPRRMSKPLDATHFEPSSLWIVGPIGLRVFGHRLEMEPFDLKPMEQLFFRVEHEVRLENLVKIDTKVSSAPDVHVRNLGRKPLWVFQIAKDRFTFPAEAIGPGTTWTVGTNPGALSTLSTSGAGNPDSPFRRDSPFKETGGILTVLCSFLSSLPREKADEPHQEKEEAVRTLSRTEWRALEPPHYLVLATEEAVFPAVEGFPVRKAVTIMLFELPEPSGAARSATKGE